MLKKRVRNTPKKPQVPAVSPKPLGLIEQQRAELATLIGRLLARHWLAMKSESSQSRRSQKGSSDGLPSDVDKGINH
jgi:hypothetical protein